MDNIPPTRFGRHVSIACGVGIAVAAVWAGFSVPSVAYPVGSDWGHHFSVAEYIWHPKPGVAYPLFRRPFYGWLMGALGEGMGYFAAAQFIGRMSAVVVVVGAGLGAWALVGPLAGLVSSLCVVVLPLVMHGATWVNHYPLLGAACMLGLGAGAAMSRWPRVHWAILAGLGAGVAAVTDVRGEVVLPAVLALTLIGLPWRDMRRTVGLLVVLVGVGSAVLLHSQWLEQTFDVPKLRFEEQLRIQRKGVLSQIQQGTFSDPALEAACAEVAVGTLDAASINTPCATALRANAWRRLSEGGDLPDRHTLMLLALVLLPMGPDRRERVRSSVASAVVFGVPLVGLFVGMGWVTYFPRYVLPYGGVMAMLAAVALGRMLPLILGAKRWVGVAASVAALGWTVSLWPGHDARSRDVWDMVSGSERAAGFLTQWAKSLSPERDSILDCAGLAIDSLLLPSQINYVRFPPGDPECDKRVRNPIPTTERLFLITMHRDLPENATGITFDPAAIAAAGWSASNPAGLPEGYRVWLAQ